VLIQPSEEQRIKSFGHIVSVVGGAVRVKEDRAQFLLQELGLVRERDFQGRCGHSQKFSDDGEDIGVSHNCSVLVSMTIDREFKVPKVENGRNELTSLSNVTFGESSVFQSVLEVFKSKAVVVSSVLSGIPCSLAKVAVGGLVAQMKVLAFFGRGSGDEVVENVEVPLSGQVVIQGLYSAQATTFGKLEFGVFTET